MPLNRDQTRAGLLFLALALVILFYRLFLNEVFFWGLPALQFHPWRDYAIELLRQGQLPLWNPFNGAGAPLLANYQTGLLYPLNWPSLILPMAQTMSLMAVLHLMIAGAGMAALTRRLGANAVGQGVGALSFGLCGYLVARLGTYPIIMTVAWLPWMLWAVYGVMSVWNRRAGAWLAFFAALLLLAGHAQTAWYSLLMVGLFSLWLAFASPLSSRERLQRVGAVVALLGLGAGVAALQLIPTAELLRTSQRSEGVDYDFAMNLSYAPARLLNLFAPQIFGTPADGSYYGRGAFFEDAVYIGVLPLIAALAALFKGLFQRRRSGPVLVSVPFWALIGLIGLVFALGQYTPIFPFLYRAVPTFDLFQAPVRWHLWTVTALAVLAALGATTWTRSYRARRWTRRVLVGAVGMVILTLAFLVLGTLADQARILLRTMLVGAFLVLLACWLTLRQPEHDKPGYGRWSLLVLVVVAADLIWANAGLNPTVPAAFYTPRPAVANTGRSFWPLTIEERVKFEEWFTFNDYRTAANNAEAVRSSGLPNLNLLDRDAQLNNFDPLLFGPFKQYLDLIRLAEPAAQANLLRAAGVDRVYTASGRTVETGEPGVRAWLVRDACWYPAESSLTTGLLDPDWQPEQQVLLLGDGGCSEDPVPAVEPTRLLVDDRGTQVQIELESPADGWLVLADVDYPGWHATLDGQAVPIYRANSAFRAVQINPGVQTIVMRYEPGWLLPGAVISAVCLLVILLLFRTENLPADSED